MSKLIIGIICFLLVEKGFAQNGIDTTVRTYIKVSSVQKERDFQINNIFLLGKIWGFLKYYHPVIAKGKYNWDEELFKILPKLFESKSIDERNSLFESWISQFGNIPICIKCNDSVLIGGKLKPDFSWINRTNFSESLIAKLKDIEKNRIQDRFYYTQTAQFDGLNYIQFPNEKNYSFNFPNDKYAILALFRFWNTIEYWYPYKYGLPVSWDSVLKKFIPKILSHKNVLDYNIVLQELVTTINDSHGTFQSLFTDEVIGKWYMPFTIKFIENKLVISSILNDSLAEKSNIKLGDVITKINNSNISNLMDSIAATCPASNKSSLLIKLLSRITRTHLNQTELTLKRSNTFINTISYNYIPKAYPPIDLNPSFFSHQRDSSFFMINNSIGYINMGVLKRADSLKLKSFIHNAKRLIIDNRQNSGQRNGAGAGDIVMKLISPRKNDFAKFSFAQPSYPGLFTLSQSTNMGTSGTDSCFKNEIIILIDANTMSGGEFLTMAFQKAPKARTLGTRTAGADGNITYIVLPGNFAATFSGLGVYYPNGKETQRVGIKPDIFVEQRFTDFLNNKDTQLEAAVKYLSKGL